MSCHPDLLEDDDDGEDFPGRLLHQVNTAEGKIVLLIFIVWDALHHTSTLKLYLNVLVASSILKSCSWFFTLSSPPISIPLSLPLHVFPPTLFSPPHLHSLSLPLHVFPSHPLLPSSSPGRPVGQRQPAGGPAVGTPAAPPRLPGLLGTRAPARRRPL